MLSLKLIVSILLSSLAYSKDFHKVSFGNQTIEFKQSNSKFFKLSKKKPNLKKKIILTSKESAYKNPYSVACKKINGKVRIGRLENGSQLSFCFFQDKSIVSTNALNIKILGSQD